MIIIPFSMCFSSFFLHSTFTFIDLFLLSSSPGLCGLIPSVFYSHAIHSNVYGSLVWRYKYVSDRTMHSERKDFSIHTAVKKWDMPVRFLSLCFIFFDGNVCFNEQSGNKDQLERTH